MTVQNLLVPASCGETVKNMPYQPDVFMAGFYVISRLTWEQGSSVYLPLPILLIFKRHLNEQNLYTFLCLCYAVSAIMANTYKMIKK